MAKRAFCFLTLAAACGVGTLARGAGPATAPAVVTGPTTRAAVEETALGNIAAFTSLKQLVLSADVNHAALMGVREGKHYIVLDDKEGPAYDWIIPESLGFSPDARKLAFVVQTATDTLAVIDGKPGKPYYGINHNRVFWSHDGQHWAYGVLVKGGGAAIVADGVELPHYDAADSPQFSPDGKRLAYRATRGGKQFIVLDGKELKAYAAVAEGSLIFSANSRHLAYEAGEGAKHMLVMNDQEGKAYDGVKLGPGFSTDSGRVVAVVDQGGKTVVVINGKESPAYDHLMAGDFTLSADGKRVAYGVEKGGSQFIVLDGTPQESFQALGNGTLRFSPDSQRVVYQGSTGKSTFLVLDGKHLKPCDNLLGGTPLFSPDSKRMAYGAQYNGKWQLVVDGVEGKAYDLVEPPTFSPDSKRIAYRAVSGEKTVMVVADGTESKPLEYAGPLAFSPDSKHLAYLQRRDGKIYLAVDGQEVGGPYNPATPEMRPVFDDNTTAHLIVTRKDDVLRVKVKL
jgi:Tol biopolymer transport system component